MLLLPYGLPIDALREAHGFFDDFDHVVTADRWTTIADDSGSTVTVGDGVAGIAKLAHDGTDEDESYLHTTIEQFKMADNKPIVIEARLQFAEAATDAANVIFGVKDGVAANALQDAGAGPAASYNGACFFKVDGGTRWQVESSITTTQTTSDTKYTAGGAGFHTLRIEINNTASATIMDVKFFIDTSGGRDFTQCRLTGKLNSIISHQVTLGTALEMDVFVGLKNGSANAETLSVDYITAYQRRFA